MDQEAAAPVDDKTRRLECVREDNRLRFNTTVAAAIGCIIFGILLSGVFDSNQKRFTTDLYAIIYAVNNATDLAYVPFNCSRVVNDTAMEVLMLDVLPEVKRVYDGDVFPFLLAILFLAVLGFLAFILVFSAAYEYIEPKGEDPSPETCRAAWTYYFGIRGFWLAVPLYFLHFWLFAATTILSDDFLLRLDLSVFGIITLAGLIRQAIPASPELDWKRLSRYTIAQKRFIALLVLTFASVILLLPFFGATASRETRFVLAIQRLRRLVEQGVSFEKVLSEDVLAKLKSDVLPFVSQESVKLHQTRPSLILLILSTILTIPTLLYPWHTTSTSPTFPLDTLSLLTCLSLFSHDHPANPGTWFQLLLPFYGMFSLAAVPALVSLVGDAVVRLLGDTRLEWWKRWYKRLGEEEEWDLETGMVASREEELESARRAETGEEEVVIVDWREEEMWWTVEGSRDRFAVWGSFPRANATSAALSRPVSPRSTIPTFFPITTTSSPLYPSESSSPLPPSLSGSASDSSDESGYDGEEEDDDEEDWQGVRDPWHIFAEMENARLLGSDDSGGESGIRWEGQSMGVVEVESEDEAEVNEALAERRTAEDEGK
ncbi:hypothetical protein MMC30_006472 [Trapelia coarctata]|nr:hypothetical protein [Trapelia coarctata]